VDCGLHIRDLSAGERTATYGWLDLHGKIDAGCLFITSISDLLNLFVAEGATSKVSGRKAQLTNAGPELLFSHVVDTGARHDEND
jgi:hypothetical protein